MELTHFKFDIDQHGIATVLMDRQGESMNTLAPVVADDLEAILGRLEDDEAVRAVVIGSAKEDNFLAGADIRWFEGLSDPGEAVAALADVQEAFNRIEQLHRRGKPVVAAIHGPALGGGLELALACQSRISSDDHARTQFGQPEVKIGVIPAAGGTQRLPRLIGIQAALDLILTGRTVRPARALKLGLVDEVVPRTQLLQTAKARALSLIDPPRPKPQGLAEKLLEYTNPKRLQKAAFEENPAGRLVLFNQAQKRMQAETRGNYPAPEAALRAVRVGYESGVAAGLEVEREEFGRLVASPEARALRSIFFATQELKNESGVAGDVEAEKVAQLGILGGGLMGGGIAAVTATKIGIPVVVKEVDEAGIERAKAYVSKVTNSQVKRRRMTRGDAWQAQQRVSGTVAYESLAGCDLVIEAVFEDLDLKQRVLKDTEAVTEGDSIFASNTSSIPITAIAEASSRPDRVIGMHYFSPVEKMPLLEVVVTGSTDPQVTATCVEFGKRQGKTVIVVNDGTGFYTTRVIAPYSGEALLLLQDGATIEEIDKAMVKWGFPVGPLTLSDEVGIDVGAKIAKILEDAFGERMKPPPQFAALVADDRKGRKNGRGFYRYDDGKKGKADAGIYDLLGVSPSEGKVPLDEIQDRVALAFINEAVRCLDDGILRSARDGDIGAVMGLGFPPFRGGPFHWIDQMSPPVVLDRLEQLAARHGPRFEPAPLLREKAMTGGSFR